MSFKKIFFAVLLFAIGTSAQAQLEKGRYSINTGISSRITWDVGGDFLLLDNYTFGVGYLIKDGLEIGLKGDFNSLTLSDYSNESYSVGAYSRYYFSKEKKRLTPYVEGFLGGGRKMAKLEDQFNYDARFLKATLGIGADFWITKKFAVSTGIQYEQNFNFDSFQNRNSQLNFNIGTKFNF